MDPVSARLATLRPGPLPPFWQEIKAPERHQRAWAYAGLRVLASLDTDETGARWYHVSASSLFRRPSPDEVSRVRRAFFQPSAAVEVWPPKEFPGQRAIHLWERLPKDDA
jgi:hypothetical protein